MSQGELQTHQVWDGFTALLCAGLAGVDVQEISEKDFNESGELIMNPPSVRSFFAGEGATSLSDSQRLSYNVTGRYLALCADQDLTSPAKQAKASLCLAGRVKGLMAGARIALPDSEVTEPVTFVGMEPEALQGVGVAYAVAFEVPGLAQFEGANAHPAGGDD